MNNTGITITVPHLFSSIYIPRAESKPYTLTACSYNHGMLQINLITTFFPNTALTNHTRDSTNFYSFNTTNFYISITLERGGL